MHQPGFNELSKNENIQLQPSPELAALLPGPVKQDTTPSICPEGSVKMRLPSREAIVRIGSLKKFFSKSQDDSQRGTIVAPAVAGHEYATSEQNINAIGVQATLNIWSPVVANANEFSLSQLWLSGWGDSGIQTVEVGYQVYPLRFQGSTQPHLFIYYTADGYNLTGCYDLGCGFVQTSNILNIGGVIGSSTVGGTQVEGTVAFYRDPTTGNWILFYRDPSGNYIQSGYYPKALFGQGQLSQYGTQIKFGGEVHTIGGTMHTTTDMGSGQFSNAGYSNAAYQRNLAYMDLNGVVQNVSPLSYASHPNCYTITTGTNISWGTFFYFGGPGYSASNTSCQ